jgi:hypothetical protein
MPSTDFYENRIVLIDESREKLHVYMRVSNLVYITVDIQNKCIERNEMHILSPARCLLKSCCSPGNLTEEIEQDVTEIFRCVLVLIRVS